MTDRLPLPARMRARRPLLVPPPPTIEAPGHRAPIGAAAILAAYEAHADTDAHDGRLPDCCPICARYRAAITATEQQP